MMKKKNVSLLAVLLIAVLGLGLLSCGKDKTESRSVPILMYHAFSETEDPVNVSRALFSEHLQWLQSEGYQTVFLSELQAFAEGTGTLPEKPVVIVSDDGYSSALEYAVPEVIRHGEKMDIALIGCSIGKDYYKDSAQAMNPHFFMEDCLPYKANLELVNHSFDLHQVDWDRENHPASFREGALKMKGEPSEAYLSALRQDFSDFRSATKDQAHWELFAYPFGFFDEESEKALRSLGVLMTLTTEPGIATIEKGNPETLFQLPRLSVDASVSVEKLCSMLKNY